MRKRTVQAVVWGVASLTLSASTTTATEARFFRVTGPVPTVITDVTPDGWVMWTNIATDATSTVQTTTTLQGESNWVDWVQVPVSGTMTVHRMFDPDPPEGMVFIPAGIFMMGATTNVGHEYEDNEVPQHSVNVSVFYMDRTEVTKALWDEVKGWSSGNGYTYDHAGSSKAPNHPVQTVSWYDCVKWCNARSQREGLTPCYYTDAGLTSVYRTSQVVPYVNWSADGYRLPTEAEWEKAARGGLSGKRFPWGDTISHSQANYYSSSSYAYDISPTRGYHPDYNDGTEPYTSPVGDFAPNAYGLYDMAGNVREWCWDWYESYSSGSQTNPQGPASGSHRVLRGGGWGDDAFDCRTAHRSYWVPYNPYGCLYCFGFRCVRPPGQ